MNIYSINDFARCQRPDGSTYGTAGTCRKGVQIQRMETGLFSVFDSEGKRVGSIIAEDAFVGGGGIREKGRQANYTAAVGKNKREGLSLAQAKAQVKEWLGEQSTGNAKVAIKGGLTPGGKRKRLENISREIDEVREKFNRQVSRWNAIPKEQRRGEVNLRKNIEYLRSRHQKLQAEREMIEKTPIREN